jgi:glycosyltransferase involved in cell wall biosynthesis
MPEQPRERIGLIVVGDGELRQSFEAASRKAISRRAIFVGFINQSQIGKYYAAADCLILPSAWGETWGLVVNEALQFGLPAIVSDRVGCYPDLIVEDETGYVFPVGDAQQLCMCMLKAMNLVSTNRDAVSQRCRSRVAAYSVQAAAEGIRAAVFSL